MITYIIKNVKVLLVQFLVIILLFSCATNSEINSMPNFNMPVLDQTYVLPTFELAKPIENLGYIIPVSTLKLMPDSSGIIVRTKNIDGFETFDAITVKVNRIIEKYALVEANDYYEEITLNKGDMLVDEMFETMKYLNKVDHEWLKEGFRKMNK